MRFTKTDLDGVYLVEAELVEDSRGFFARLFCPNEMIAAGIDFVPLQTSLSRNKFCHTLRGMHFTSVPEAKLVRCSYGAIFDVIVDLRPDSPTYRNWESFELRDTEQVSLYVPAGCAHGFQALTDPAEWYAAGGSPARLEQNRRRMMESCLAFLALDRVDSHPMSEYVF